MEICIDEIRTLVERIEAGWRPLADHLCIHCSPCTLDIYTALALAHIIHLFKWVGVRENGACRVVISHDPQVAEGSLVPP